MVSPVIIAVVAFACCICIAVGVYFATKGGDSPAPAPTTTPATTTPTTTPTTPTTTPTTPTTTPTPVGTSPSSTTGSPVIPVVVNPPPVAAAPPPPAVATPNPYISIPSPPPPAPSVRGFVSTQTVNRAVNLTPNSPTAPTPGDTGVADGTPINQWNVPNLNTAAYLRFPDGNIMKVRNIAYYNFYGYFINASGAATTPYSSVTRFPNFQLGNFYP